jgi:DNA-directed RNA polymerase specialized sigma54-like protein
MLAADGVQVARRTVAKYREALGIATSSARRQAPR